MNWRGKDTAFVALLTAAVLAAIAAMGPRLTRERALRDLLFVVDITQSMNVRDMTLEGREASRLAAAKAMLGDLLAALPCGSRAGLAVFTERRSLTFVEPVEVCENYAPLSGTIEALDWRMAWEGDSFVAKGVHHAIARAGELDVDLVFLTDGHEAPPLPYSGMPEFAGEPGEVGGVLVGVGGDTLAPIPKHDDQGREIGFHQPDDVQHAPRRIGPPPEDAEERPGYHPRNNPYGEADLEGNEHLSALGVEHLRELGAQTGLGFIALNAGREAILSAIEAETRPRVVALSRPIAALPGAGALVLLILAYLLTLRRDRGARSASTYAKWSSA